MKNKLEHIRIDAVEVLSFVKETENRLNSLIDTVDLALQSLTPLTDLTGEWENGDIRVHWKAEEEGTFDLVYQATVHDKWFSYKKNVAPIDLKDETAVIGVNINETFTIKAVYKGEVIDEVPLEKRTEDEEKEEEPANYNFLHSLWDSHNYGGDEFNMEKTTSLERAKEIIAKGKHCVLSFSGRWKDDDGNKKSRQQWESMIGWMSDWVSELDPEKTLILIQDEPQHFGYTDEEIEFLYTQFKDKNPDYKFGYSLTRNAVRNKVQKGFKTDFAMLPLYLFSGETTKEEFDSYFDEHIRIAREKMDAELLVIGQAFYNTEGAKQDWTEPPIEAIWWYVEAIIRNNLKGLIWYVYYKEAKHTVGLKNMKEYWNEILKLSERII